MTSASLERETVAPDPSHEDTIRALAAFLESAPSGADREAPYLSSPTGERQEIPGEVYSLLTRIVEALSQGRGVSVVPTNTQLTTQQAADHLGISRPTLVKLLERGEVPFTTVGRHRRVLLTDLLSYERDVTGRRRAGLAEETRETTEEGAYFDLPPSSHTR